MKFVLLCRSLGVGGTERQLVNLAKGMHQRGNEVTVVVFYSGGPMEAELRDSNIPVIGLHKSGRWDVLPFYIRTVRMIRKLEPGAIYGFLGPPNILAVLLKPIFPKIRIVWGVRSSIVDLSRYDWLSSLSYRIECWLSRFANLIICNSYAGLNYAAKHGFPRERMTVIPNGIDIKRFKSNVVVGECMRAEWGITEDEILIGIVGRLDPMKDLPTFLQAAAILAKERPDVRFVCVGDGSLLYREELHQLANKLELNGKLVWAGPHQNMPAVFNALDIASSSSYGEGFSNTIAEAMACGVPCVVTNVGDSALIVGNTGEVVPPSNPEALCEGFRLMLKRLGPDLQIATRTAIVDRFTNDAMVANTVETLCRMD